MLPPLSAKGSAIVQLFGPTTSPLEFVRNGGAELVDDPLSPYPVPLDWVLYPDGYGMQAASVVPGDGAQGAWKFSIWEGEATGHLFIQQGITLTPGQKYILAGSAFRYFGVASYGQIYVQDPIAGYVTLAQMDFFNDTPMARQEVEFIAPPGGLIEVKLGIANWTVGEQWMYDDISIRPKSLHEWRDVTPESVNVQISWGTDDNAGALSLTSAGSWSIVTYDPQRLLDPANTASEFLPYLVPGGMVRLVFRQPGLPDEQVRLGFIDEIEFDIATKEGTIRATDAISLLVKAKLPDGLEHDIAAPTSLRARAAWTLEKAQVDFITVEGVGNAIPDGGAEGYPEAYATLPPGWTLAYGAGTLGTASGQTHSGNRAYDLRTSAGPVAFVGGGHKFEQRVMGGGEYRLEAWRQREDWGDSVVEMWVDFFNLGGGQIGGSGGGIGRLTFPMGQSANAWHYASTPPFRVPTDCAYVVLVIQGTTGGGSDWLDDIALVGPVPNSVMVNGGFDNDLTGWTPANAPASWYWQAGECVVTGIDATPAPSPELFQIINVEPGGDFSVSVDYRVAGTMVSVQLLGWTLPDYGSLGQVSETPPDGNYHTMSFRGRVPDGVSQVYIGFRAYDLTNATWVVFDNARLDTSEYDPVVGPPLNGIASAWQHITASAFDALNAVWLDRNGVLRFRYFGLPRSVDVRFGAGVGGMEIETIDTKLSMENVYNHFKAQNDRIFTDPFNNWEVRRQASIDVYGDLLIERGHRNPDAWQWLHQLERDRGAAATQYGIATIRPQTPEQLLQLLDLGMVDQVWLYADKHGTIIDKRLNVLGGRFEANTDSGWSAGIVTYLPAALWNAYIPRAQQRRVTNKGREIWTAFGGTSGGKSDIAQQEVRISQMAQNGDERHAILMGFPDPDWSNVTNIVDAMLQMYRPYHADSITEGYAWFNVRRITEPWDETTVWPGPATTTDGENYAACEYFIPIWFEIQVKNIVKAWAPARLGGIDAPNYGVKLEPRFDIDNAQHVLISTKLSDDKPYLMLTVETSDAPLRGSPIPPPPRPKVSDLQYGRTWND